MKEEVEEYVKSCDDVSYDRKYKDVKPVDKLVCKQMLKALYFVNRLGNRWKNEDGIIEEEAKIREYMRCIIVSIFMYKLLESSCGKRKGVDYAVQVMENLLKSFKGESKENNCMWMKYNDISMGGRVVGRTIRRWLLADKSMRQELGRIWRTGTCQSQSKLKIEKKQDGVQSEGKIIELLEKYGEKLKEEEEKSWEEPNELLGLWKGYEKQDECAKGTFCERTKCVANKWVQNRTTKNGVGKSYSDMWDDGDIGADLKKLSAAMTDDSKTMGDECQDFGGMSSTNNSANKTVCELITAGLKHIYEIKVEDGDKDPLNDGSDQKSLDNQLFKQTMSCVLLNAFADKMIEQTKGKPCAITEDTINRAFTSGNTKKEEWCKVGGEANCFECIRDATYKGCEIVDKKGSRSEVKNEVEKMLQNSKNAEARQVIDAINNLCATTKPDSQVVKPSSKTTDASSPDNPMSPDEKAFIEKLSEENVNEGYISSFGSICGTEDEVTGGIITKEDQNFCKIILRNFLMTTMEDNSLIFTAGSARTWNIDRTVRCQILNLWMKQYKTKKSCDPEKMYEYIERNVKELMGPIVKAVSYQQCNYGADDSSYTSGVDTSLKSKEEQEWKKKIDEGIAKMNLGDNCGKTVYEEKKEANKSGETISTDQNSLGGSSIPLSNKLNPFDLLTPYFPTIPVAIATSVMSYLLWKYFGMLPKARKRHRKAYQVRGPTLQEQVFSHVDNQADDPHAYTLVKEGKPRSTPIKRRKREGPGRRVGRRMIIDIHLEVLDECQMGDTDFMEEDFLKIIVEEFMGSKFIKEESVLKEQVSMADVPKEEVSKEQVPSSDSRFTV
ncbi:SICA antigen [Plasmodium coatneyi]|uniref:SICA antigen n=1 Tax=Plasmodium coatneyi TaxID=208452 RepID=A0A1B1DXV9_9APIC|nr:SICA antigen [Plasmodium coatneyi]ANQ07622.1 SICA antigen [Plasmodium coatneyi]